MKQTIIFTIAIILIILTFGYSIFTIGIDSRSNEINRTIEGLKEQGYSQSWAEHITLVELHIIPADSLYIAIEED